MSLTFNLLPKTLTLTQSKSSTRINSGGDAQSLKLSLRRNSGIKFGIYGKTYEGIALYKEDGKILDLESLQRLSRPVLLKTIFYASRMISDEKSIKSFIDGQIDNDVAVANGEIVLAMQARYIWDVLVDVAKSSRFSKQDILEMFRYIYEDNPPKPFRKILSSVNFNFVLRFQRELFYSAMGTKSVNMAEASKTIDKLPSDAFFLLDREPTILELVRFFTQTEDEAEKNLVLDRNNRCFLLTGANKNTGTISYRIFPNLIADFHTHRKDWSFSTSDIVIYKSLGESRDIWGITSQKVHFYVCSPRGIFRFNGNLDENIFDQIDRGNDRLAIPCTVINEDTGEQESFSCYTNHTRGESGRYIHAQMQKNVARLKVSMRNGDITQFTSWEELKRQGKTNLSISSLYLMP